MPFRSVVGHARLLALLSRAVARETLPPALLLGGPAGIGKRRTALAIAEALNCLEPQVSGAFERDACGACTACRRIGRGVHPDVIVLEPGDTGSIKIEPVREVIGRTAYRPFEARRRVVIVDEADALVPQAQNALLKTLEEPPSASVFILVSSMPDALLATVRSRCPRLRFGPLAPGDVADLLMREHGYGEAEARAAAADADGSISRALQMQSADLTEAREAACEILQQAARSADPSRRIDAAKALAARKTSLGERDQLAVVLRVLASLLRDIAILATGGDARLLANADLTPELQRLSSTFGPQRTARTCASVDRALGALDRNASAKVVADWLVLEL